MGHVDIRLTPHLLLTMLAAQPCENFTTGDCAGADRCPLAAYGAEQMCVPCMARLALAPEAR